MVQINLLAGRNRDTDIENKSMDTKGRKGMGRIEKLGLTHIQLGLYLCTVYIHTYMLYIVHVYNTLLIMCVIILIIIYKCGN